MGILFRQVEGYTEWGVGGELMVSAYGGKEGVPASDPVEEDAGEPWVLMGKQMVLLTVFHWNSSCLCWGLSKAIKSDPKVHDQDVIMTSCSRTGGPPAASSPSFL